MHLLGPCGGADERLHGTRDGAHLALTPLHRDELSRTERGKQRDRRVRIEQPRLMKRESRRVVRQQRAVLEDKGSGCRRRGMRDAAPSIAPRASGGAAAAGAGAGAAAAAVTSSVIASLIAASSGASAASAASAAGA